MENSKKKISIVLPVFNEEAILQHLYARLIEVKNARSEDFEFIFVNDGSTDNTLEKLLEIREKNNRVNIIDLARRFGQQSALTVGLDEAEGDAVILMDADMEDSPEDILKFFKKWDEGYQVVYAIRKSRRVGFLKRALFNFFHKLNKGISETKMPASGTFSLLDRVVVDKIKNMREHNRYIPGLRSWVGFKQVGVELDRGTRYDSKPRVRMGDLYALAIDSFTSFSSNLLSLPFLFGLMVSFLSGIAIVIIVILKIFFNIGPWGWPSLVSIILFFSGLQLALIGLLGEYVSRILTEIKNRPLYIVKEKYK